MPTGGCLFVQWVFSFCLTGIECVFKQLFNKFHLFFEFSRPVHIYLISLAKFSLVNEFFSISSFFHISDGCSFMAIIRDIIINIKLWNGIDTHTHSFTHPHGCNRDDSIRFCSWFLFTSNWALFQICCSFLKNVIDLKTH